MGESHTKSKYSRLHSSRFPTASTPIQGLCQWLTNAIGVPDHEETLFGTEQGSFLSRGGSRPRNERVTLSRTLTFNGLVQSVQSSKKEFLCGR